MFHRAGWRPGTDVACVVGVVCVMGVAGGTGVPQARAGLMPRPGTCAWPARPGPCSPGPAWYPAEPAVTGA